MSPGRRSRTLRRAWRKLGAKWTTGALAVAAVVVVALAGYSVQVARNPPRGTAPTPQAASLWMGDSYTAGTGAESADGAESRLTAQRMGWICHLDAQGGTGFIADGRSNHATFAPLIKRLPETASKYAADIVIIDGGRNDLREPFPTLKRAISAYLAAVRKAFPRAELVQIVPYYMRQTGSPKGGDLAAFLRDEMEKYHGHVIDPAGEGWISGAKSGGLVNEDMVHPSPQGHRYIAKHLAADLRQLDLKLPIRD